MRYAPQMCHKCVPAVSARRSHGPTSITNPAKVHAVVENFRAKYGAEDVKSNYPKLDVAVEVAPA